jgi:hypothetical protein
MGADGWSWATLELMQKLRHRTRTLLGAATATAVLILPATALADCAKVVDTAAFKGSITQYYPQACYSAGLTQLGPDVDTYSPNVARNVKSAMRRDRTRKLTFTIQWMPRNRVRVTSKYPLKSTIQLRKGAKVLAKGSISAKTTTLKLKKTTGKVTVALGWLLGSKTITVSKPATLAKVVKKK